MDNPQPRFPVLLAKTIVSHTLTYFIMGALAAYCLNYAAHVARPESGMRPFTSPWVSFCPCRGRRTERVAVQGLSLGPAPQTRQTAPRLRHPPFAGRRALRPIPRVLISSLAGACLFDVRPARPARAEKPLIPAMP